MGICLSSEENGGGWCLASEENWGVLFSGTGVGGDVVCRVKKYLDGMWRGKKFDGVKNEGGI